MFTVIQVITALLLTCIEVFVLIVWMLQEKPEMIKMYSPVHINQKVSHFIILKTKKFSIHKKEAASLRKPLGFKHLTKL